MSKYILGGRMIGTAAGFTDQNSGASMNLGTCWANALPDDQVWWRVGERAIASYDAALPEQELIICAHPDFRGNPLAAPSAYTYTWGRAGAVGKTAMASWAASAPRGYVALSGLFGPSWTPDPGMIQQACFIPDCLLPTTLQGLCWNDSGSGADDDGSVWVTKDGTDNPWQYTVPVTGYDQPAGPFYVLNPDVIEMM